MAGAVTGSVSARSRRHPRARGRGPHVPSDTCEPRQGSQPRSRLSGKRGHQVPLRTQLAQGQADRSRACGDSPHGPSTGGGGMGPSGDDGRSLSCGCRHTDAFVSSLFRAEGWLTALGFGQPEGSAEVSGGTVSWGPQGRHTSALSCARPRGAGQWPEHGKGVSWGGARHATWLLASQPRSRVSHSRGPVASALLVQVTGPPGLFPGRSPPGERRLPASGGSGARALACGREGWRPLSSLGRPRAPRSAPCSAVSALTQRGQRPRWPPECRVEVFQARGPPLRPCPSGPQLRTLLRALC